VANTWLECESGREKDRQRDAETQRNERECKRNR